jgi:hypothetical protein
MPPLTTRPTGTHSLILFQERSSKKHTFSRRLEYIHQLIEVAKRHMWPASDSSMCGLLHRYHLLAEYEAITAAIGFNVEV